MPCPKCGSTRIRRSRTRDLKERLQKLFNQRAYRCLVCDWRGILKAKTSRTGQYEKQYMLAYDDNYYHHCSHYHLLNRFILALKLSI